MFQATGKERLDPASQDKTDLEALKLERKELTARIHSGPELSVDVERLNVLDHLIDGKPLSSDKKSVAPIEDNDGLAIK